MTTRPVRFAFLTLALLAASPGLASAQSTAAPAGTSSGTAPGANTGGGR